MPWLQVQVRIDRSDIAVVEDLLLHCGALSITLADSADHPILEPGVGETPLWPGVLVTGLFDQESDRSRLDEQLQGLQPGSPGVDWHWQLLEDRPWERAWMDHFQPIQCGERLWICPSWCQPPDPGAINLQLDPGLAFGSGTHPTTFLCLQWLDRSNLAGRTVLDYGCGSGILGIAALLLGADRVIAVDNDPQALLATRENLARNNLPEHRLEACLPGDFTAGPADLVLANILAGPLIELAPRLAGSTRERGWLCLSGITTTQADAVTSAYPEFKFEPVAIQENWVRLTAVKIGRNR